MSLQPSTKPRRNRRRIVLRWIKRFLLAALGAGIVGAIVFAWLPKPVVVDVAIVGRKALDVEVDEQGQTRVRDRFVVAAPISGTLRRIELDAGESIGAGGVLAWIEPPSSALLDERSRREAIAHLAVAVAQQRAAATAVARATVARDATTREAQRARRLFQRDAIPAAEREHADDAEQLAQRDLAAVEAQRASAAAEVAAARAVVGDGAGKHDTRGVPVTSPIAGQVLRVVRDSSGPVVAGAPLLELGDLRAVEVVVDVLSSDGARIRPGMPVLIEQWGGDVPIAGAVRRIEPSAFTRISALGVEEQRVKVIVQIDQPPATLGDGFRVEARIFTWRGAHVLAVPASAVFRDHGRWAVYAIEHGRARLVPIEVGHRGRTDVEVVGGLVEGARIILHPSDRVSDRAKVAP